MADENEKVEAPEPKHEDTPLGFKREEIRCGNCGQPATLLTPLNPKDGQVERVLPHYGCRD